MLFNYQEFHRQVVARASAYMDATPYPYAIFDGLFDEETLNSINSEIEESKFEIDSRDIDGEEVKKRSNFEDNESVPQFTRKIFEILNGGRFLNSVSRLTGIEGLISDPYFDGGGINIIEDQGTLSVHIDGTNHYKMSVCRRLNAILFLNDNWNPEWNGYHEQWDFVNKNHSPFSKEQRWKCIRKILPKKNRLLIFTTNDHSWHGHAGVLNIPKDEKRKSLIAYYYTASRPKEDVIYDNPHRALFIDNKKTLSEEAFDDAEVIL